MNLSFWKVESIGNDFPLFHLDDIVAALSPTENDLGSTLAKLAVKACDRHFGIGGDGILTVQMKSADLELRMFNPDGTEDFCGNGIRCAAVHAHRAGWVGTSFKIIHLGRNVPTEIDAANVATIIGSADYTPQNVPHRSGELFNQTIWSGMDSGMPLSLFGSALSTGSTHVVIPTFTLPDDDTFASVSPKIETDPQFPKRTSVIWSKEIEPMHLQIRIWERGVGETQGCGTGSSAAAADYLRRKGKGGSVRVDNPGGTVTISMDAWNAPIQVVGQAKEPYSGVFSFEIAGIKNAPPQGRG